MISPPTLRLGNCVGIVAPARKVSQQNIESALNQISSWGLAVKFSRNIFSNDHGYLASSDLHRLEDFQEFISDPSIHAIVCARGGYGTTRILDKLDFTPLKQNPKWIIGYSDITAIHLKLFKIGLESIHALMPINFGQLDSTSSIEKLKQVVFNGAVPLLAKANPRNKTGVSIGRVIGGNLSLIAESLGTSSEIDTEEKILLIEEIDEPFYKVDRMLVQLGRAGKLEKLKGIAVGHFTDIKNGELKFAESIEELVLYHTRNYSFPIGFGFPFGHENPNFPWIHGSLMRLEVSEKYCQLVPLSNKV